VTNPHKILSKVPLHLLKRLPDFVINPDPTIYLSDNFVVFDLETNTKGDDHSPLPCWPQNSAVCGSWTKGIDGPSRNIYGNELEMGELVDELNAADFIIAHNGKFDIGWMKRAGIDIYKIILFDTCIAEYVIRGNLAMGHLKLDEMSKSYLGYSKAHFIDICMKGKVDPEDMPESKLVERCNSDIKMTRDIFLIQREKLERLGLLGHVYTRCLLSMPLVEIESKGIHLDKKVVEDLYHERAGKLAEASAEIDLFTGGINPNSPKQVREFVYTVLKFKPKMKGKGRNATPLYPTGADDLLALKATTKRQRDFVKLKKTYAIYNADISKALEFFHGVVTDPNNDSNIFFANFNQTVTVTHRLSSTGIKRTFIQLLNDKGKPKTKSSQLQNVKREFKCTMSARKKGWLMGEADGAQLEFRVAAFLGQCRVATQAIVNNVDVHSDTASQIHGMDLEEFKRKHKAHDPEVKDWRQMAKPDTFKPLFGGQSGTPEQVAYYEWFAKHYNGIAEAQQDWIDQALIHKRVKMIHGFRFFFPHCHMSQSGYVSNTTNIKNYPVQHFATAEIIPIAIVYIWHLMKDMESFLVNTVHDSVVGEIHPDEVDEYRECSKYAFTYLVYHYLKEVYDVEFNVPLGIGVKIGANWGKGEELKCVPLPPYRMEGIDYKQLITEWIDG